VGIFRERDTNDQSSDALRESRIEAARAPAGRMINCPGGTVDNSPAFQRRVRPVPRFESRRDGWQFPLTLDKERFSRPFGTSAILGFSRRSNAGLLSMCPSGTSGK